jgi:hypothetical protein
MYRFQNKIVIHIVQALILGEMRMPGEKSLPGFQQMFGLGRVPVKLDASAAYQLFGAQIIDGMREDIKVRISVPCFQFPAHGEIGFIVLIIQPIVDGEIITGVTYLHNLFGVVRKKDIHIQA